MANDSLQKKRDSKRWVERAGSLLCVNVELHNYITVLQVSHPKAYQYETHHR